MAQIALGGIFQGGMAQGAENRATRALQEEELGVRRDQVAQQKAAQEATAKQNAAALLENTIKQIVELKAAAPDEQQFAQVQPIIAELVKDAVALAPAAGRDPGIIGKRLEVALKFAPTVMGAAQQKGAAEGATAEAAGPGRAKAAGLVATAETNAKLNAENSPEAIAAAARRAGAVSQAQAQGTARGTPKGPESPEGKRVADRELFVSQYGENSPQVQAFDESTSGKTPGINDVAGLRKEYIAGSKDFVTTRDAFGKIAAAKDNPSAAGDLALIFNYMKMLDPGSTVREGEFANAQNATGVPQQVMNMYNKALTGERLAPEQREDFVNQAGNIFRVQLRSQVALENQYRNLAERQKMRVEDAVIDLIGDYRKALPGAKPEAQTVDDPLGILGGK